MLTSLWKCKTSILLLLAVWLVFECYISWAAFCDQGYPDIGFYEAYKQYGCIFRGPMAASTLWFISWWNHVFDKTDAYIALFTAILAIFTFTLWLANYGLLKHAPKIERAYVSGGFGGTDRDSRAIFASINNDGKTPCIINHIALATHPLEGLPQTPV